MTDESVIYFGMACMPPRAATRGRKKNPGLVQSRCAAILRVGTAHFARVGYQETDLEDVARELGVAKGTLYRYFPSKKALFLAAADHCMIALREHVHAASDHVADPLERLRCAISAYLDYFKRHPDHVEMLILERAVFRDRGQPTYFEHRRQNAQRWKNLYADLIRAGRVRNIPISRLLDVIHDLVYGTMFTNHFTGQHKSLAKQTDDIMDILFHGILTQPLQK